MNESETIVRRSLLTFCCWLLALTAIAIAACFIAGEVFHLGYPFNTFLFVPRYRFSDLTDFYFKIRNLRLGGEMLGTGYPQPNYPAPALYVYAFFIRLFPNPVAAVIGFSTAGWLAALLVLRRQLIRPGVDERLINYTLLATAVCAYPLMLAIDRANIEAIVWFFLFLGLTFFVEKRFMVSALFFAAAICIKPFPGLFFFLFLTQRKYKEIVAALAVVCVTNLVTLKAVGPTIGIALKGLQPGVLNYFHSMVIAFTNRETTFDHSIFSCVKQLMRVLRPHFRAQYTPNSTLLSAYTIWMPISGLILIAVGFYFWRKPVLNQVFAVVLAILLLPPVSADYTLLDLYLPWGLFMIFLVRDVGSGRIDFPLRKCLSILIPCAVIFTPQSYLTFEHGGFAGQIKALVLIFLFFFVARVDMPASLFNELPSTPEPGQIRAAEPLISR